MIYLIILVVLCILYAVVKRSQNRMIDRWIEETHREEEADHGTKRS